MSVESCVEAVAASHLNAVCVGASNLIESIAAAASIIASIAIVITAIFAGFQIWTIKSQIAESHKD